MAYTLPQMYNIDNPVGDGLTNRPDDVRLVQTLLVEISRKRSGWQPAAPLKVDGQFQPAMTEWIKAFQKKANGDGAACVVDGKVHPMKIQKRTRMSFDRDFGGVSSTMFGLNVVMRRANRAMHQNLPQLMPLADTLDPHGE